MIGAAISPTPTQTKLLSDSPSGLLMSFESSIPGGFIGRINFGKDDYSSQYDNTSDLNTNRNPSQLLISEVAETKEVNHESYFSYSEKLSISRGQSMKEFDFKSLHGAVFDSTDYHGNVDHVLILKDGNHLLTISSRDGTKTIFSSDDLIAMLETFVRQK